MEQSVQLTLTDSKETLQGCSDVLVLWPFALFLLASLRLLPKLASDSSPINPPMIITQKMVLIRNLFVSGTNGALTLIILLIAPLGLTAVIINTTLVILATFTTAQATDRVIRFLQSDRPSRDPALEADPLQVLPGDEPGQIQRRS